jgi:ribosomal protein S18 acetylase RimI-like enzyme
MSAEALELRPTIDRLWLEEVARLDPLTHAYALWDLDRLPQSVRFVSALERGRTVAYLLAWFGQPGVPVVHWVGEVDRAAALAERFPRPPFVGLVPTEAEPLLRSRFPRSRPVPVLALWRPRGSVDTVGPEPVVRRLRPPDAAELRTWSEGRGDADRPNFGALDLAAEHVWGAFESGRLVGVARAAVRLPGVWVVSGVYVDPEARGHGLGRRLVSAMIDSADRAGAPTGLYVREDAGPARKTYTSLGYREVGRRLWLEVVTPAEPAPPRREARPR